MKRFIRYLYEYEQEKRMRNVGFVKVEQDEEQCTLHIHGKGFSDGGKKELTLYVFYVQDGQCTGICLAKLDCQGPALNESFRYTKNDEAFKENYDRIEGVILENEQGRRYASMWSDIPADISGMRILKKREENPEKPEDAENTGESGAEPVRISDAQAKKEDGVEADAQAIFETVIEKIPAVRNEEFPGMKTNQPPEKQSFLVRKIQRMEISKLARCEWKLSNNNFLMHGYYNYHHLVFLENDSQFMLGVPGIYHEKEARAAEIFGFPKFLPYDELDITLNPEEKNEEEVFGYWCRPVKRSLRWEQER